MKKITTILACTTLMSSCAYIYEIDEQFLAQEKNIIKTLKTYRDNCRYNSKNNSYLLYLSENKEAVCCRYFDKDPYGHITYEDCGMSDDKCIIYERNHPETSRICYFNYKKYLPKGVADNDQEFLVLENKYESFLDTAYNCNHNNQLTQIEKQQCYEQAENNFINWAMSGGAKKQINKEIEQNRIAEQKKKEQQAIEKAKAEAQKADCKQATEKAQKRLNQIKSSVGTDFIYDIQGKVVDFADNGIIISTDCSGIWNNSWWMGELGTLLAANCKEERSFIYTKDTNYATNDKFNDKGLLYKKVNNFKYTTVTGATMSIPAYKETSYKASEINYQTYLKDKSIAECN